MRVLAAVEPLTPILFLAISVIVLVHVTMSVARRTAPLWGGARRRSRANRKPAVQAAGRPSLSAAVAPDHSRWTSPGFWRRMDADLSPLSPADRDRLLEERIEGLAALRRHLAPPGDHPHS